MSSCICQNPWSVWHEERTLTLHELRALDGVTCPFRFVGCYKCPSGGGRWQWGAEDSEHVGTLYAPPWLFCEPKTVLKIILKKWSAHSELSYINSKWKIQLWNVSPPPLTANWFWESTSSMLEKTPCPLKVVFHFWMNWNIVSNIGGKKFYRSYTLKALILGMTF